MAEKHYIQVVTNEVLNPIVDSQVFRRLASKVHLEVSRATVVALVPVGLFLRPTLRRKLRDIAKKRKELYGIETRYVINGTSRMKLSGLETLHLRSQLRRLGRQGSDIVVLARNATAMCSVMDAVGKFPSRVELVFDCRGDGPSELIGGIGAGWDSRLWSPSIKAAYAQSLNEEKKACGADRIISVSHKMAEMLNRRHGVPFSKIHVEPCKADVKHFLNADRAWARKQLGVGDRKILCYLGSLAWYQLPDQSIRVYKAFKMLYPNSIFLALTTDVGKMQELLDNEGFTKADYIVMQVSSEDVPRYLGAADLGLLLREDNPVNAVASPVKFAEYLACGVPVLVTSFVGDYSALVVSEKLGAVVDTTLSDADLADLLEAKLSQLFDVDVRSRCRAFVEDRLSWPTLKQVSDPAKN